MATEAHWDSPVPGALAPVLLTVLLGGVRGDPDTQHSLVLLFVTRVCPQQLGPRAPAPHSSCALGGSVPRVQGEAVRPAAAPVWDSCVAWVEVGWKLGGRDWGWWSARVLCPDTMIMHTARGGVGFST